MAELLKEEDENKCPICGGPRGEHRYCGNHSRLDITLYEVDYEGRGGNRVLADDDGNSRQFEWMR